MRIEFERTQVLTLRQQEWDAANSYLFGALLGSIRDLDHAIIRAHQGDGASAWRALRAVYAGADSTAGSSGKPITHVKLPFCGHWR